MCKHALYSWCLWESNNCAGNWTRYNFTLLMKVNISTNFPGNPSANCWGISLDEWKMWPVGGAGWKWTDRQESCSEHICTKLKGNPFSGRRYFCLFHGLTNKHQPSLKPAHMASNVPMCISTFALLSCLLTWLNIVWEYTHNEANIEKYGTPVETVRLCEIWECS